MMISTCPGRLCLLLRVSARPNPPRRSRSAVSSAMKTYPIPLDVRLLHPHITAMDEVGRNSHVSLCLSRMETKASGKKTVTEDFAKKSNKTQIAAPITELRVESKSMKVMESRVESRSVRVAEPHVVIKSVKEQSTVKQKSRGAAKRSPRTGANRSNEESERKESLSIPVRLVSPPHTAAHPLREGQLPRDVVALLLPLPLPLRPPQRAG